MGFWSGERLEQELPKLVEDFHRDRIDCASYRLRLGGQAFITSDRFVDSKPSDPLVTELKDKSPTQIPAGQFAFLLTLETVKVPSNAIALISIRSGYKFGGLMNVSGFHVDPGWEGKLLFSVYNAGPQPISLERGDEMFLIVYADLDRWSDFLYDGKAKNRDKIEAKLISGMIGQVFSPIYLQRQVKDLTDEIGKQSRELYAWKKAGIVITAVVSSVAALLIPAVSWLGFSEPGRALLGGWVSDSIELANRRAAERTSKVSNSPIKPAAPRDGGSTKPAERIPMEGPKKQTPYPQDTNKPKS